MKCKKCQGENFEHKLVTFSNGTEHVEIRCFDCNTHNGYQAQNRPIRPNAKMPFGKYKGKTIAEIAAADPYYALWCSKNLDKKFQDAFLQVITVH